jgi:hypothetical protein
VGADLSRYCRWVASPLGRDAAGRRYRLFFDFKIAGVVRTAEFTVIVA